VGETVLKVLAETFQTVWGAWYLMEGYGLIFMNIINTPPAHYRQEEVIVAT